MAIPDDSAHTPNTGRQAGRGAGGRAGGLRGATAPRLKTVARVARRPGGEEAAGEGAQRLAIACHTSGPVVSGDRDTVDWRCARYAKARKEGALRERAALEHMERSTSVSTHA